MTAKLYYFLCVSVFLTALAAAPQVRGESFDGLKTELSGDSSETDVAGESGCVPFRVCFNHYDCRGGTCLGMNIGKCNCNACLNGTVCANDHACGGLKKACSKHRLYCNCEKAFKKHGLYGTYDEIMKECQSRYCVPNTMSCFGLPCNAGLCAC